MKKILLLLLIFYLTFSTNQINANHDSSTWEKSYKSVVKVLPTWPGYGRPGFGAPPGTAPEGTGIYINLNKNSKEYKSTNYVITAAHVISKAKRIELINYKKERFDASIIKIDFDRDIAILKTKESGLPAIFSEEKIDVGNHACVIGNSFGLGLSFSCGVISAIGRKNIGFNKIEDFIQTDAAVNPGASGGALVKADGSLIGMIDAIFTKEADIDAGVNFAISTELIMQSIQLIDNK